MTVCVQEMAVRALKQTGSRNIEAALDYISKMGYLDPRTELIVRVIKQTSPGTHTHTHTHAHAHAHSHSHLLSIIIIRMLYFIICNYNI